MPRRKPHRRNCADCGAPVNVFDRDELAMCAQCIEGRRTDELELQLCSEEPSTISPDEMPDVFVGMHMRRIVDRVRASLTPKERAVLDAGKTQDPE